MATPISAIRNLGPATETGFARAGIHTAEELHALGAHEAYRRWLEAGEQAHFIGYYVLAMALQGRPWNDCRGDEKKALRARFDTLKAEVGSATRQAPAGAGGLPPALDRALDAIGVRATPAAQAVMSGS